MTSCKQVPHSFSVAKSRPGGRYTDLVTSPGQISSDAPIVSQTHENLKFQRRQHLCVYFFNTEIKNLPDRLCYMIGRGRSLYFDLFFIIHWHCLQQVYVSPNQAITFTKRLIPRALFLGEMWKMSRKWITASAEGKVGFVRRFVWRANGSQFYSRRKRKKLGNSTKSLMCNHPYFADAIPRVEFRRRGIRLLRIYPLNRTGTNGMFYSLPQATVCSRSYKILGTRLALGQISVD
jgi:hypothetical protein